MNDEEIRAMVEAYGFTGEAADLAFSFGREVERTTRHGYFALMQSANNAAVSREVTRYELDKLVWEVGVAKRKGAVK